MVPENQGIAASPAFPPQGRLWIGGHNLAARRWVEQQLEQHTRPPTGPLDGAIVTPQTVDEAGYFAEKVLPRLVDRGALWIVIDEQAVVDFSIANFSDEIARRMAELGLQRATVVKFGGPYECVAFIRTTR